MGLFKGTIENRLILVLKSLVASRNKKLATAGATAAVLLVFRLLTNRRQPSLKQSPKKTRGQVDFKFLARLFELVKIVIPSYKSKEFFCLILLSGLLLLRTVISISIASVNGKIVKAIVSKDFKSFLKRVSVI